MRNKVRAYHQLEAYSLYLEDKPAELAAYRKFLVNIFSLVLVCIIIVVIKISHHHSAGALQLRGYCQQGAWAANGVHGTGDIRVGSGGRKYGSCHGCGGQGGHNDGDMSSRTDCKRKAPGKPSGGCIRHSGW
jgi:hypothetical protein